MDSGKKKPEKNETKAGSNRSLGVDTKKQISHSQKSSPLLKGQIKRALDERIKELNCFFGISAVMELPDITLDEILRKIVPLLPPAWQFPELAEACIVLEGKTYHTSDFRKTPWMLVHDIIVNGNAVGQVKVCYREELQIKNEDPFMIEERHLLDAIAERLGHIIERKWAEMGLKESEEKFRSIFNTVNDGIHIHEIGPDGKPGKFIEVNEVACQMLQYTHDEMLEHGPLDFVTGYHSRPLDAIIREQSTTGHSIFETEHRRKDGTILPVEINTHIVSLREKPVMVSVVRDITERKQVESALKLANKKMSLVSSITRHDINNQISAINMFLFLAKEGICDPTILEHLQKVEQASQLIQKQIWFTGEYDMIGITAPVWGDLQALVGIAAKQVHLLQVNVNNDLPVGAEVYADPLIVRVFFNLMDNAVKYGGKITTIRFFVIKQGDNHIIVCEDDGVGIVTEEKKNIFGREFGKSTGFGLALAKEILDITGITIKESGEPGKGARFEMTVPKGAWRSGGMTD